MPSTRDEIRQVSTKLYQFARFPLTIGAFDCTHVRIQSPGGNDAENYPNRKVWFSYNVQLVCGADMQIINIVARWNGGSHDQTIFNNLNLKMKLERGDFRNYILVCDSGYGNSDYKATSLLNCVNDSEQLYNESQTRTSNAIERAFGVLETSIPCTFDGNAHMIAYCTTNNRSMRYDSKDVLLLNNINGFEAALEAGMIGPQNNNVAVHRNILLPCFNRLLAQHHNAENQ